MKIESLCWTVLFTLGLMSESSAGYIATDEIEQGVAECSGPNLNTFQCARGIERKLLAEKSGAINRSASILQIRTARKTVKVADERTENGEKSVEYSYLGFSKKLNSHVLYVQYYEGGAYMVIHHSSGESSFPSGYPIASPDGKHFLSISEDLFAGYDPNNVEIWRVTSSGFRRVANFEPEWGPHRGSWLDPRRARINKHCYVPSKGNAELTICGVARIERSGLVWELVE